MIFLHFKMEDKTVFGHILVAKLQAPWIVCISVWPLSHQSPHNIQHLGSIVQLSLYSAQKVEAIKLG